MITYSTNKLKKVLLGGGCEQNGTPTPDVPVDIVCNNGVITVTNKFTSVGSTRGYIIASGSGVIQENSNYTVTAPIKLKKGQYTGSFYSSSSYAGNRYFRCWSYEPDGTTPIEAIFNVKEGARSTTTFTFTINSDCLVRMSYNHSVFSDIDVHSTNVADTDGTQEVVTDNLGNTANAEMLCAVGDYKDTQEVLSGSVTRNVGIKVLDGTETWTYNSSLSRFDTSISDMKSDGTRITLMYCSHFNCESRGVSYADVPNNSIYTGGTTENLLYLKSTSYASASALQQYLQSQYNAGSPVIVVYPLATPTTEQVTPQPLAGSSATVTAGSIDNLPIESSTIAELKKRYIGDKEVERVYIGDNLVWENNNNIS